MVRIRPKTRQPQIRPAKELRQIINYVRAKYILAGKTPPSIPVITKRIAEKINKEDLYTDEFIRF